MIELLFKDLLDTTGYKGFTNKLPEQALYPAMVYQVSGFSKEKVLDTTIKSHSTKFKVDVFANTYPEAKAVQAKIFEVFEDLQGIYEDAGKFYSISADIENVKDLYDININKIVIDIVVDYYIN